MTRIGAFELCVGSLETNDYAMRPGVERLDGLSMPGGHWFKSSIVHHFRRGVETHTAPSSLPWRHPTKVD